MTRARIPDRGVVAMVDTGALEVVVLEDASLSRIRTELERRDIHVFHYIGHGTPLADGYGALALTAPDGSASLTRADELAAVLADAPGLRLAVLNACHGAAGDVRDPCASVAASLVKAGVPAVIAMAMRQCCPWPRRRLMPGSACGSARSPGR